MKQRKFKILTKHMRPPFQGGFSYELGRKYECKDFDTSDERCSNGYYATDIDGLIKRRAFYLGGGSWVQ